MGIFTGEFTGNPQEREVQFEYCPSCGASVLRRPVRLAGGTYRTLLIDVQPWTGDATRLRLTRSEEGQWRTDPLLGQWQEHACRRL